MLRFDGVCKSYCSDFLRRRRRVLRDVSFEVQPGETFAYLGHNGAGKTTSIKALLGLIRIDRGSIEVLGHSPGHRQALGQIGYVPENPYFYDHLTGREFLRLVADLHGLDRRIASRRVDEVLGLVSMRERAEQRMRGYSKGMLQRMGLAQALINDPRLLVLDEPMGGLDPMGRHHIRTILGELRSRGKTILFSSHILSDVEAIADRAAILSEGALRRIVDLSDRSHDSRAMVAQCRDLSPAGAQRLREQGLAVELGSEGARIRVDQSEELPRTIELIQEVGARLLQLAPARMALEQIFLHEVGPSGSSGAAAGSNVRTGDEASSTEEISRLIDQISSVGPGSEREEVRS